MDSFVPDTPLAPRRTLDTVDAADQVDLCGSRSKKISLHSVFGQGMASKMPSHLLRKKKELANRDPLGELCLGPRKGGCKEVESKRPNSFFSALQTDLQSAKNDRHNNFTLTAPALTGHPNRNHLATDSTHNGLSQSGDPEESYKSIQDAISIKFRDLEAKIQTQAREMTELKFSLNDAEIATDSLEAAKRQLKKKNEGLEQKLKLTAEKNAKLEKDLARCNGLLDHAMKEQQTFRQEITEAINNSGRDQNAFANTEMLLKELRQKLESSQAEASREITLAIQQQKQGVDNATANIAELSRMLQQREEELQAEKKVNANISKQLKEIPEQNFQALSTCVKTILERLDQSKNDAVADGRTYQERNQLELAAISNSLESLSKIVKDNTDLISKTKENNESLMSLITARFNRVDENQIARDSNFQSMATDGLKAIHQTIADAQAQLLDKFFDKKKESDILTELCQNRERDLRDISSKLSVQESTAAEQINQIRQLGSRMKSVEILSKKLPEMASSLALARDKTASLESELSVKVAMVSRLEEKLAKKEHEFAIAVNAFSQDVQKLSAMYRQREEDYRQVLERASELSQRESRRNMEENKQETQKELQRERIKRQDLERQLQQSKEALLVLEEKDRWNIQCLDGLRRELDAAKLGRRTLGESVYQRARSREEQQANDSATITKLSAMVLEKEAAYTFLKSAMEASGGTMEKQPESVGITITGAEQMPFPSTEKMEEGSFTEANDGTAELDDACRKKHADVESAVNEADLPTYDITEYLDLGAGTVSSPLRVLHYTGEVLANGAAWQDESVQKFDVAELPEVHDPFLDVDAIPSSPPRIQSKKRAIPFSTPESMTLGPSSSIAAASKSKKRRSSRLPQKGSGKPSRKSERNARREGGKDQVSVYFRDLSEIQEPEKLPPSLQNDSAV